MATLRIAISLLRLAGITEITGTPSAYPAIVTIFSSFPDET